MSGRVGAVGLGWRPRKMKMRSTTADGARRGRGGRWRERGYAGGMS